jgi:heme-degrading monooxygenase HmoA
MSVIVTIWIQGDPEKVEQYAADNQEAMRSIVERAKAEGLIAHRFYGSEGQAMVIDEWPDAESFQRFFASAQDDIAPIMQAAGVQNEPAVNFWRKLETHDEVGWER